MKVAGITSLSATLVALSTAYAFARLRFSGRDWLDRALFMGQMFPSLLLVVAFYTLFDQLGEYVPMLGLDTHGGLILALFGQTALGMIWAFKGFFAELPKEIEEAARIDGASDWQIFWRIALPLARPMIAVMVTLTMTGLIYEPMLSSALLTSSDKATIATRTDAVLDPDRRAFDGGRSRAGRPRRGQSLRRSAQRRGLPARPALDGEHDQRRGESLTWNRPNHFRCPGSSSRICSAGSPEASPPRSRSICASASTPRVRS